jgi:hypothetical protein
MKFNIEIATEEVVSLTANKQIALELERKPVYSLAPGLCS